MLRSAGAVVAGLVAMVALVMVGTMAAAATLIPGGLTASSPQPPPVPPPSYLAANVLVSVAAAVLGGWLAARLAPSRPMLHAGLLAAVVLVLSVVSFAQARNGDTGQPLWYLLLVQAIGRAGALAGGWLRARG